MNLTHPSSHLHFTSFYARNEIQQKKDDKNYLFTTLSYYLECFVPILSSSNTILYKEIDFKKALLTNETLIKQEITMHCLGGDLRDIFIRKRNERPSFVIARLQCHIIFIRLPIMQCLYLVYKVIICIIIHIHLTQTSISQK